MASDFRDNYLSKTTFGLAFIRFYNQHQITPGQVLAWMGGLMMICLYAGYRWRLFVTRGARVARAEANRSLT
jgi:hypothetical protein